MTPQTVWGGDRADVGGVCFRVVVATTEWFTPNFLGSRGLVKSRINEASLQYQEFFPDLSDRQEGNTLSPHGTHLGSVPM